MGSLIDRSNQEKISDAESDSDGSSSNDSASDSFILDLPDIYTSGDEILRHKYLYALDTGNGKNEVNFKVTAPDEQTFVKEV